MAGPNKLPMLPSSGGVQKSPISPRMPRISEAPESAQTALEADFNSRPTPTGSHASKVSRMNVDEPCTFLFVDRKSEDSLLRKDLRSNSKLSAHSGIHMHRLHSSPLQLFYLESLFRRTSRSFLIRTFTSTTSLDPIPDAYKLFLVVHAEIFGVFLDYLSQRARNQSIRGTIKGIAVLQSSESDPDNLPNTLINLDSRFNAATPLTWVQVKELDVDTLFKGVLELEKMTHTNGPPSSKTTVNFKLAAEFMQDYDLHVRFPGPRDGESAATTSKYLQKGIMNQLHDEDKAQRSSSWPRETIRPSQSKSSPGIVRASSLPTDSSKLYTSQSQQPSESPYVDSLSRYKALLEQADTYHSRGQLRDAESRFRDIIRMKIPKITHLSAMVSLAVIDLQKGRHLQAENTLNCIIKEAKEYPARYEDPPATGNSTTTENAQLSPCTILLQDAMFRRATARARLGLYFKVFTDLKQIVKLSRSKLWSNQDTDDAGTGFGLSFDHSALSLESRPVSEVALDAGIARLCALSAAYSGHSPEVCLDMLAAATAICSWLEIQGKKGLDLAKDTDQKPLQSFLGLRIAIQLTGAKIHMMHGNLAEAQSHVNGAWKGAKENLPSFSALTLEVGLVLAHVSALTHHFTEARQLCKHIAALTSKHLGDEHPFGMEADWVLILSATLQGRYVESMITSRSLNDRAASSACLHPLHPLTLKYKSQLAGIYLRLGYYQRAESLLKTVRKQSRELWPDHDGKPNPCTLQYLSQLSLAQCFNGKTTAAEESIQVALRYQPWPTAQRNKSMECQSPWFGATFEGSKKCLHFHMEDWLHPDTMFSVLIRGWIEMSKESPNLQVTRSILSAREHARAPPGYPHTSEIQLLWSLALGQVQSAEATSAKNSIKKIEAGSEAVKTLSKFFQDQRQPNPEKPGTRPGLFPEHHPLLTAARRDLLTIQCFLGTIKPERLPIVKASLRAILKAQEINPGWAHPDTLQTMLCLLATEVALDSTKRNETDDILNDLRQRLNSRMMRTQCVMQRLRLLENITGLLESLPSYFEAAGDFLVDIESTTSDLGPGTDGEIVEFIENTKAAARETFQVQTQLQTQLQIKAGGQDNHRLPDGASHENKTVALSSTDSLLSYAHHFQSMNAEVARNLKDPLGLTTIHDPGVTASSDIVFVHGLSGGSESTWIMGDSMTQFWPKYWLPEEPEFRHVRIHSFGYNSGLKSASAPKLKEVANSLLSAILDCSSMDSTSWDGGLQPLIFVAHSLGGLVIKQACLVGLKDPKFRQVADRINAVIFLGTPHRAAETASMLGRILTVTGASQTVMTDLLLQSKDIQSINTKFQDHAEKLSLFSYQETRPVKYGAHLGLIVDKKHAVMNLKNEHRGSMDASHLDIARYASREDPSYRQIKNALATQLEHQRRKMPTGIDSNHPRLRGSPSSI